MNDAERSAHILDAAALGLGERVDQALAARFAQTDEEFERIQDEAQQSGRFLQGLGPPGSGKTTVAEHEVERCIAHCILGRDAERLARDSLAVCVDELAYITCIPDLQQRGSLEALGSILSF